jgi:excisionase family DNA binding protein
MMWRKMKQGVPMSQATQTHVPTAPDIMEARQILEAMRPDGQEITVQLEHRRFTLPHGLVNMLREILVNAANGEAMTIIPINAELTSQEAAEYLRVSRQFLINEAEAGRIPYRKIGSHRRFAFQDVLAYQRLTEEESLQARQALTDEAQVLGLDR